jgi:hypothetical protein
VGEHSWSIKRTREQVVRAYSARNAPVPKGAHAGREGDGLVIRAPFSTTAVFFERSSPKDCVYSLVAAPTLVVEGGGGKVPAGEFSVAVGYDDTSFQTGKPRVAMMASLEAGGKPWVLWIGDAERDEDGNGAGGSKPRPRALYVQAAMAELQQMGDQLEGSAVPAKITARPDGLHATFKNGRSTVTVDATRTHSFCGLLLATGIQAAGSAPDDEHVLTCVTKEPSATLDRRVAGVGGKAHGKPWRLTTDDVVGRIEAGERFYLKDTGDDAPLPVSVAVGTTGAKYLSAKRSGERGNAVLGLPKCR